MNLRKRSKAFMRSLFIGGFAVLGAAGLALAVDEPKGSYTEAELLRKVEERDAVIRDLLRRVAVLESQAAQAPTAGRSAAANANPAPAPSVRAAATASPSNPQSEAPPAKVAAAAPVRTAASPNETVKTQAPDPAPAPGKFEVDEDAAERALERTLVQAGVLLLPLGVLEVQPSFGYTRNENTAPLVLTDGRYFAEEKVRRHRFDAGVQFRLGLPWDSQFEFRVPYRHVRQTEVIELGGSPTGNETSDTGSSIGDLRIGLAKTLLREGSWWPDLVARLAWDTDTGDRTDGGVTLGGGFHEIIAQLSATKRQDPLAFVGGLSYRKAFEDDDIKPGREIGLSLGVAIAASPETSLRFVVNQAFRKETEFNNETVDGSDVVDGRLTIGASSIVGHGAFVDVATDVGLTDDSPDYAVNFSISKRFDLRSLF